MTETSMFRLLTGSDADNGAEARNGLRHAISLSMTKIADGLIDPKLVLSWLLTTLGAPAAFVGALVPIREAGALLPQVVMAGYVARMRQKKWAWVAGSAGQGVAAALIALAAFFLSGAAAGWAICGALAVLAVCRALCSVSYKDILGKTVDKTRRGAITGVAASAASAGVIVFAVLLISGLARSQTALVLAVALAAVLWGAGAFVLSTLEEPDGAAENGSGGVNFALIRDNRVLRQFILVRGLLVSTALAPPYLVILGGDGGQLGKLGALVLASAGASLLGSWLWGRAADRSSRKVMMATGVIGAVAMLAAVGLSWGGLAQTVWAMPVCLFVLMLAYGGVRQGRSTYLVDIAPKEARAAWTAVANTAIGTLLLIAGALGGALSMIGAEAVLIGFALMALAAPMAALGLDEAET